MRKLLFVSLLLIAGVAKADWYQDLLAREAHDKARDEAREDSIRDMRNRAVEAENQYQRDLEIARQLGIAQRMRDTQGYIQERRIERQRSERSFSDPRNIYGH